VVQCLYDCQSGKILQKTRQEPKNTRKEEHFGRPRRALFSSFEKLLKIMIFSINSLKKQNEDIKI
jgi:hypothetical protein